MRSGLSLLSGAHRVLFKRVIDLLEEHGAEDIMVFGGGTIHENDIPYLKEIGVKAIFTPGRRRNRSCHHRAATRASERADCRPAAAQQARLAPSQASE